MNISNFNNMNIFSNLPNDLIIKILSDRKEIKKNEREESRIKHSYNYHSVLDQLEGLVEYTVQFSYDEEGEYEDPMEYTFSNCLIEVIWDDNLERNMEKQQEEDFGNYYGTN